ncbi:MAG: methionyl-tRNA formyltransferase [Gammaproteobacteria bacterium]|nr:MAG: methionyl-tRNA formyltransferase [Gammaproteobacteria bacterium]
MRIIFAGTPEFSVPALQALLATGYDVVAVYTQPDRQAGRGRKTRPGPIKQCAQKHGLVIEQPAKLKDASIKMKAFSADVMVVAAYGLLLPPEILQIPVQGCLNIHASLLPHWRGAAPIHRAIEAGDKETGITIMQVDSGLDTGDILAQYPVIIEQTDTGQQLHDRLADVGATAITNVLSNLAYYQKNAIPQQNELSSYARKISKKESNIDWSEDCEVIERRIRAFYPWPGTQTWYRGIKLRISQAECSDENLTAEPGTILSADKSGIRIACGKGVLRITKLQRPGGKALCAADFLNGMRLDAGAMLEQQCQ